MANPLNGSGNSMWAEALTSALGTETEEKVLSFLWKMYQISTSSGSLSSADSIGDDLLVEIFKRLPVLSLLSLNCVSKDWSTFVKGDALHLFRNRKIDPPSGLIFEAWDDTSKYRYAPIEYFGKTLTKSPISMLNFDTGVIKIIESCNGLFLCTNNLGKYYIYNPTTRQVAVLPRPTNFGVEGSLTLGFDPSKSLQYKVIWNPKYSLKKILVYCSDTRKRRVAKELDEPVDVDRAIYGNNAVHWVTSPARLIFLKLDDEKFGHMDIVTPESVNYGPILDEFLTHTRDGMVIALRSLESSALKVYAIKTDYSGCLLKFCINLEGIVRVYPSTRTNAGAHFFVHSLVVEEQEHDSYVVLELPGKIVQYRFLSNSIFQLCDFTVDSGSFTIGGFFPRTAFHPSSERRRFIKGRCLFFIPSLALLSFLLAL